MDQSNRVSSLKQRLAGRNLYLIGMMGCGKSSTGPHLADLLGYAFIDSDQLIEKVSGRSIPEIFQEDGEIEFRNLEKQVLNVIGQRHSLVVATGGGLVTIPENWGILHQGIVIWIDPGRERLLARIQADAGKRPLLETQSPVTSFDELHTARQQFYAEADMHLHVGEVSEKEVAMKIIESLPSILSDPAAPGAPQTIEE